MAMWVRLRAQMTLEYNGKARMYYPGDFVELGKQTALRLITDGMAESPDGDAHQIDLTHCALSVVGDGAFDARALEGLTVQTVDTPAFTHPRMVFVEPSLVVRTAVIPVGLRLLETWDAAAPLYSYETLAVQLGDAAERARTADVIGDLRVPVYETRLLFLRRTPATQDLLDVWMQQREGSSDDRLAFLRAFFLVKPRLLPLPTTWAA